LNTTSRTRNSLPSSASNTAEAGNWYLEAVRAVLSSEADNRTKARRALPLCAKALEAYEKGGDPADVLVAARLRQYLIGLSK